MLRLQEPQGTSAVRGAENAAAQAKACPGGATYADCQAGLAKLQTETKPAVDGDLGKLYAALAVAAKSGDVEATRKQIRASVVSILKAIAQPALAKYASKLSLSLARLAELRIHVEALGSCDAKKLAAFASPPALGAPLDVRVTGTSVEVRPPAWADDKKVWTFRCAKLS